MSLRDELAERLAIAFVSIPEVPKPVIKGPYATEYWLRVADECIRQMEWARRPLLDALEIVQGADQHDGQYDGCSLCRYAHGQDPDDPKWGHLARHEPDCPTGSALSAPLTIAPDDWKP